MREKPGFWEIIMGAAMVIALLAAMVCIAILATILVERWVVG